MHIKGDVKYGARRSDTLDGIRLHAYSIEIPLFNSSEKKTFVSELPAMDSLWQDFLEKYNVKK